MTVVVAITGGSGSGKSTFAAALHSALAPGSATMMSEDWYFCDVGATEGFDPATFDFDDISVRDHALLLEHLGALKSGKGIVAPQYCFVTHARLPTGSALASADVIIIEGSHLLCDPALDGAFDLRVYIDTPDDVRFIRRLIRDQEQRGRSVVSIVRQYLATVRPAHLRLTGPSRTRADVVITDSSAAVERPQAEAVGRLIEPLLRHPLLHSFSQTRAPQG